MLDRPRPRLVHAAYLLLAAACALEPGSGGATPPGREAQPGGPRLLVVEATVVAVGDSPAGGLPATEYVVEVERAIEGFASGGTLIVRVPGSIGGSGGGPQVRPALRLAVGERARLVLETAGDGGYRLVGVEDAAAGPRSPLLAGARGYRPRPCGFDLDDDGVVGEPEDCRICDGVTADPDGDGVAEDLIYVDCDAGVDGLGCGSPAGPCRTVAYAWTARADGPGDGAEDVVCFRGTCRTEENVTPGVSGVPGHVVRPRSGNQARDWQLPADPTMLVGWDADGDGSYPPFDGDDVAVLDGGANSLVRAFRLSGVGVNSYLEMAHFTARDYGRAVPGAGTSSGFASLGLKPGVSSHLYFHDLSLRNVNRQRPNVSGAIVFDFFRTSTQLRHLAFVNLEILDFAAYVARGAGPYQGAVEDGPFRFQNLTATAHGCSTSGPEACSDPMLAAAHAFKLWGYITGVEILDSVFDANVGAWTPWPTGGPPTTAVVAAQCTRDWAVVGNELIDWKTALVVQGHAIGYCDGAGARTVDDIVFDRNVFRNGYQPWLWGDTGVSILSDWGPNPNTAVEDVTISNNFFSSTTGLESVIYVTAGNNGGPNPGTIRIVNNTGRAALYRAEHGAITIGVDTAFPQQSYLVKNNVFTGLGAGRDNVHVAHAPSGWDADYNVFDGDGVYAWDGAGAASLGAWRAASGGDQASIECVPAFVDAALGDLHLLAGDTCARDAAADLGTITDHDVDGDPRGVGGAWDAGADEVAPIFADGFESGTVGGWSGAIGI